MYHKPVMLDAAIKGLSVKSGGLYVDATYGGGGHSRAILQKIGDGKLVAFDQDIEALQNVPDDARVLFLNHNFRYLKNLLKWHKCIPVDGILADLGVSSHQIDESARGFSTRFDGPLDMRMNRDAEKSAKDILNQYPAEKLSEIFFLYGELNHARKIAEVIEKSRPLKPLASTGQLMQLLQPFAPRGREVKFMARVFQALRIEVNGELEALRELLIQSLEVLKKGGRLVVISYHSLEDRLVKNFIKAGNFEGNIEKDFYGNVDVPLKQVTKLIRPSEEEVKNNSRARSARLRIAEKL